VEEPVAGGGGAQEAPEAGGAGARSDRASEPRAEGAAEETPLPPSLAELEGQPWSEELGERLEAQGYVVYERENGTVVVRRKDAGAQEPLSVQDGKLVRGLRGDAPAVMLKEGAPLSEVLATLRGKSTSWPAYEAMLKDFFGVNDAELTAELTKVLGGERLKGDADLDFVRHGLKKRFEPQVLKTLDQFPPEESQRLLLAATDRLNPADRGTLAEQWYARTFLRDEAGELAATRHPMLDKGAHQTLKDRYPDHVRGDTLHEIKAGRGKLTDHDIEQFQDFMTAIRKKGGATATKGGEQVEERVTKAVYTFVDPEGAKANVETIVEWLGKNRKHLKVEIFDQTGRRHEFTYEDVAELRRVLEAS